MDAAARIIQPGITTDEIDVVVHEATIAAGMIATPHIYTIFRSPVNNFIVLNGRYDFPMVVFFPPGGYPSPLNYNFFPKSCCTYVLLTLNFLSYAYHFLVLNHHESNSYLS